MAWRIDVDGRACRTGLATLVLAGTPELSRELRLIGTLLGRVLWVTWRIDVDGRACRTELVSTPELNKELRLIR